MLFILIAIFSVSIVIWTDFLRFPTKIADRNDRSIISLQSEKDADAWD